MQQAKQIIKNNKNIEEIVSTFRIEILHKQRSRIPEEGSEVIRQQKFDRWDQEQLLRNTLNQDRI